jgi:predicted TIM-barrel fold metal-dependent hydrolase
MSALSFKPRVPVFDANVRVGDLSGQPAPFRDRAALLAELDRHGVARAVIYHALTEEISPGDGNRLLEPWLDADDRLVPQWSVLPTAASLAQVQALHGQGRVSSVRLHDTRVAGLPFRPWAYDPLLAWLSAQRLPLWIPLPSADADELVTTLQVYPDLVTVLVGAHYVHQLLVRPLLARLPNAHLELSRYEPIGEIEALRDEFGAHRLVYGSWYWQYAMGPMLFYLHHTDLNDEELARVCAGNLERILGPALRSSRPRGEGRAVEGRVAP